METIKDLLDAVKAKAGVESNNGIAGILGVRRQRVTDYYNGDRIPDNIVCKRIAEYLGHPLPEIIATVGADSEKDEERREEWRNYLKSIGGIAASFMLIGLGLVTFVVTVPGVAAKESTTYDVSIPTNTNYALFRRWIRAAISAARHTLTSAFRLPCFSG